jgi:TetR/AcrR family tetracycline transcriptional repressor
MAETILQEFFADLAPLQPGALFWQTWFAGILVRLRHAMLAYPDGARVIAGARPQQTLTLARIAEDSSKALGIAEFPSSRPRASSSLPSTTRSAT